MIEEGLALYDLQHFIFDIVWVCDTGSNLKKTLEKFTVVHCIAHRLNNVLQKTFYQAELNRANKDIAFNDYYIDSAEDEDDRISEDESEEAEESGNGEQLNDKRTTDFDHVSRISSGTNPNMTLAQLSSDTKRILVTIIQCREFVKHIKKVNLMAKSILLLTKRNDKIRRIEKQSFSVFR